MSSLNRIHRPSEFRLLSPARFSPALAAVVIAALLTVGLATWFAGVQYGRMKNQQAVSEAADIQRSTNRLGAELTQQQNTNRALETVLKAQGTDKAARQIESMRTQILRLQAQIDQFETSTDLDRQLLNDNAQLITAFSVPGMRLIPLRGLEAAVKTVAYALIAPNNEIILVASALPHPSADRDFQLWISRKEEPHLISVGVFSPDDSGRALVRFSTDPAAEILSLEVTDEPLGGGDGPMGPKVLTSEPEPAK